MERITLAHLNGVMGRMSRALNAPQGPVWTRDESGRNKATVGALILEEGSRINGISWAICQIMNEDGGQKTLLRGSTARELWDAAQAWLNGFDAAKR